MSDFVVLYDGINSTCVPSGDPMHHVVIQSCGIKFTFTNTKDIGNCLSVVLCALRQSDEPTSITITTEEEPTLPLQPPSEDALAELTTNVTATAQLLGYYDRELALELHKMNDDGYKIHTTLGKQLHERD